MFRNAKSLHGAGDEGTKQTYFFFVIYGNGQEFMLDDGQLTFKFLHGFLSFRSLSE